MGSESLYYFPTTQNRNRMSFASISFTEAVKAMQEKMGSRAAYARMEKGTHSDGLTEAEMDFISARDSFYMASIGTNGYPYIQHRGGPKGFLKVLDNKRIGFLDYRGNMQYISVGNLSTNPNVALILVDYPARARLKILAKASIVELKDDPSLFEKLEAPNAKVKPERMMVFTIDAYDWNCPQHIVPRYTLEEIEAAFEQQREQQAS